MRNLVVIPFVALALPAAAQEERGGVLDQYFACLVGQGAVEILHGGDSTAAWFAGLAACRDEQKAVEEHQGFPDADAAHDRVVDAGTFAQRALEQLTE